jgi:hypothetical protein
MVFSFEHGPLQSRSPKTEIRQEKALIRLAVPIQVELTATALDRPRFRDSDFGLLSAFGFRPSVLKAFPDFLAGQPDVVEAQIQS